MRPHSPEACRGNISGEVDEADGEMEKKWRRNGKKKKMKKEKQERDDS